MADIWKQLVVLVYQTVAVSVWLRSMEIVWLPSALGVGFGRIALSGVEFVRNCQ
jgi:hypothetical protein